MAKKRVLWCIFSQVLGVLMHCIPVQGITVKYVQIKKNKNVFFYIKNTGEPRIDDRVLNSKIKVDLVPKLINFFFFFCFP